MVIKEIIVSCKKSRNFQTYEVGFSASIDADKEDVSERTRELQTMCRKHVMEQFALDK